MDKYETELLPAKRPACSRYLTVTLGEEEFREWIITVTRNTIDDSSWLAPETYTIKAD